MPLVDKLNGELPLFCGLLLFQTKKLTVESFPIKLLVWRENILKQAKWFSIFIFEELAYYFN